MKIIFLILMFFFNYSLVSCDDKLYTKSLYSYIGYLTTPSAYINDGEISFHYTYIPFPIAFNSADLYKVNSDNWIFSSSLGMFPFLECYFSVFIEPQRNVSIGIPNFGANKFRSAGAKIKIYNESRTLPSIAIGLFDPNLKLFGSHYSANTVSSTFVLLSKRFFSGKSSLSIGYGTDILSGEYTRLNGLFSGASLYLGHNCFIMCDYDSKYWSQGVGIIWKRINFEGVLIDFDNYAFRLGYDINMLTSP
ncbi:YjbH domain-containing protein [Candidatus Latescibacterota bacterium]